MTMTVTPSRLGRRPVTNHGEIERVAFILFAERGFENTTMDAIAEAVGVGRRTLFRYFRSKNDVPWGQFDDSLERFQEDLNATPDDVPVCEAVHQAVVRFNDFDDAAMPQHRERMSLILGTPALEAHSTLRYTGWRNVIAEYVARRKGMSSNDMLPVVAGRLSLALALTAYDRWLDDPHSDLVVLMRTTLGSLRSYLAD